MTSINELPENFFPAQSKESGQSTTDSGSSRDHLSLSSIFAPSEEYKKLERECEERSLELEGMADASLTDDTFPGKLDKLSTQMKRLNFELKLLGEYRNLPEFGTYTDLSVRHFNLKTRWELVQAKSSSRESRLCPPQQDALDNSVDLS